MAELRWHDVDRPLVELDRNVRYNFGPARRFQYSTNCYQNILSYYEELRTVRKPVRHRGGLGRQHCHRQRQADNQQ